MVAPIDAKRVITVEGEDITLRLNFRSIALGLQLGVDLFAEEGVDMNLPNAALLVKSLAVTDHPTMSEDQALAIVVRYGPANIGSEVLDLVAQFGGRKTEEEAEGNAPKKPVRKRRTG